MSVALVRANQPNPRGFEPRSAIDFTRFASLKGEFEAEGLTAIELASEAIWAARRGQGFSRTVGGVFPMHAVAETTREGLRTALDGEVPTVLRRAWNDRLDDLELDLRVRRARRTSR